MFNERIFSESILARTPSCVKVRLILISASNVVDLFAHGLLYLIKRVKYEHLENA